jgi:hypothetical protein
MSLTACLAQVGLVFDYAKRESLLIVSGNAPEESRLSLRIFNEVFMQMDASSKPGVSAGGKGQARIMLSSLDGLFMGGKDGFAACVGTKYASSLDSGSELITYRASTEKQRDQMASELRATPNVENGGLVAVRICNTTAAVPSQLAYYIGMCLFPDVKMYTMSAGSRFPLKRDIPEMPPLLVEPKTLYRNVNPGRVRLTLGITHQATASSPGGAFPAGRWTATAGMLMHVRCRGVLMFSRFAEVHDICNSDLLQLFVDIEADNENEQSIIANSELFTMQRGDLRGDRTMLGCPEVARIAAQEFQVNAAAQRLIIPLLTPALIKRRNAPFRGCSTNPRSSCALASQQGSLSFLACLTTSSRACASTRAAWLLCATGGAAPTFRCWASVTVWTAPQNARGWTGPWRVLALPSQSSCTTLARACSNRAMSSRPTRSRPHSCATAR